jgi:hypothetical protein
VLNKHLRPLTRFYQVFQSFTISCHFHSYPLIYFFNFFLTILFIHRWRDLLLGHFLLIFLVKTLRIRLPSACQTWPAYSRRFALRYFPIFGLMYIFSMFTFFFLSYSPFKCRLGPYIFRKTFPQMLVVFLHQLVWWTKFHIHTLLLGIINRCII